MKKLIILFVLVSLGLVSTGCINQSGIPKIIDNSTMLQDNVGTTKSQESDIKQTDDAEKAIRMYNGFLSGKISVEGIDINLITAPKGEPNRHYATKYAFFDSNGDNIPELHINSAHYYYILSFYNGKLKIWKDLSPYPQFYALKNGAFISHRFGAAPMSDEYSYVIYDFSGNEVWSVNFSKYDKDENGIYDKNDEYSFDGVNVTEEIWGGLIKRYLNTDASGIEQIRDEIEWVVMYEDTN